ncbi:MAG: ABC transporter [Prosthecochloris sp.]|uniref:ABC transporter related n=1 Tax=Prosthecochloris aestuarii (strain DSM 271 / SK 413) TaxID=290512 RepID=B4S7T4_PROA2|nr:MULTISPECIES: ATP-binding cassette domain-containing protein [Prosthecochloris]ACF46121.1 ABC transporter related [Prosthecochloris aestuarii DSM 271]NEX12745.1 ABC transporter [Prosthecochloris sp.]
MEPLLTIEHLWFSFSPTGAPLFEELDLRVETGDFVLLRGVSGSGKSTLLRLICRLQPFSKGRILFKGVPVDALKPPELRRQVLYVAQIPSMIDDTVKANLLFPFSFSVNSDKQAPDDHELIRMLSDFYLQDITLQQPALNLSVGQQQRVALMRALLQQPEILLLDEPTSALDADSAAMVFSIIETLNREKGMTIICVTHSDYRPETVEPALYILKNRTFHRL